MASVHISRYLGGTSGGVHLRYNPRPRDCPAARDFTKYWDIVSDDGAPSVSNRLY